MLMCKCGYTSEFSGGHLCFRILFRPIRGESYWRLDHDPMPLPPPRKPPSLPPCVGDITLEVVRRAIASVAVPSQVTAPAYDMEFGPPKRGRREHAADCKSFLEPGCDCGAMLEGNEQGNQS